MKNANDNEATFIHQGQAIDHVPEHDLDAGDVVVQGRLVGITTREVPAGHMGALQLRGVFDVACDPLCGWSVGNKVWWSMRDRCAVSTERTDDYNVYMGLAIRDHKPGQATSVRLLLNA